MCWSYNSTLWSWLYQSCIATLISQIEYYIWIQFYINYIKSGFSICPLTMYTISLWTYVRLWWHSCVSRLQVCYKGHYLLCYKKKILLKSFHHYTIFYVLHKVCHYYAIAMQSGILSPCMLKMLLTLSNLYI